MPVIRRAVVLRDYENEIVEENCRIFTSGSCLLVYKYYLQKGEGGSVNES